MAGRGSRLRPHTLTIPKPLIPIVGKPIVHRLVEDIAKVCDDQIDEIGFIIGELPQSDQDQLIGIAEAIGAKGVIYTQDEALGTAHAIICAKETMKGNVIVAFADTLFSANFKLDSNQDGIIWVQQVENPSAFGVVKLDSNNIITDFVEKPKELISNLAIIGIYYFKDGEFLKDELQHLIDNKIIKGGEYQLTDALENMKLKGTKFVPGQVEDWLDCGNKDAVVNTNSTYLSYLKDQNLVASSAKLENTVIIEPVFIGENVVLSNTVIGPNVSVGNNTSIKNSVISESLIQESTIITNANIKNSMIGNHVNFEGNTQNVSIGDFNQITL